LLFTSIALRFMMRLRTLKSLRFLSVGRVNDLR
jgi:hypothetical protein